MIEINLAGVALAVAPRTTPEGGAVMIFTDPMTAISVTVGFGKEEFAAFVGSLRELDLDALPEAAAGTQLVRLPAPKLVVPKSRRH